MRNQERGFTLIELILVIALIGILSALALPMYNVWRESASYIDASHQLMGYMRKARAMAVANNREVKVMIDLKTKNTSNPPAGGIYSWDWNTDSWVKELDFSMTNVGVLSGNADTDSDGLYADETCNGAGSTREIVFRANGSMNPSSSTFRFLCVLDTEGTRRKHVGVYSMASGMARIE